MGVGAGNDSLRAGAARARQRASPTDDTDQTFSPCDKTMSKPTLLEAMKQRPLLGAGAMGTQLMMAGLESGACGEEWNLTSPERVLGIQRRYAEAGSDVTLTNTFGGSRIMLNRHGNADNVVAINKAGVDIVRQAFK